MKCRTLNCNRAHDLMIPVFIIDYHQPAVYTHPDTKKKETLTTIELPVLFPLCEEHARNVRTIYEFFEAKKTTVQSMIRSRAKLGHLLDFSSIQITFQKQKTE